MNYIVRPGDTVYSIAARFGVPVQELIRVNNLRPPFILYAGQTLFIPVRPGPPRPPAPGPGLENRVTQLERRVDRLENRVEDLTRRVRRLEERR